MNAFFKDFCHQFIIALRQATRIYFAPFVGAYRGIRAEYADIERQRLNARNQLVNENSRH
jgi:hypothetical protein